jgi:hypothetical protein
MIGMRRLRQRLEAWFGVARARSFGLVAVGTLVAQQRPEPIRPPPPIFDLLLAILFAWGGWKVWQKGRTWRSGALILWLLALGGIYTFSRSF